MAPSTPPNKSKKRALTSPESGDTGSLRWSNRNKQQKNYAESDDEDEEGEVEDGVEENIHVGSGGSVDGTASGEEESEVESNTEIRCICGSTEEDTSRAFISCDGCGVWQHMSCVGLPDDEEEIPEKFLCERCGPYGTGGAGVSSAEQPGTSVRNTNTNTNHRTPQKGANAKSGTSAFIRSYYARDLSVKKSKSKSKPKSNRRVSFASSVKAASTSEDEDTYTPSNDPASDEDEEEQIDPDLYDEEDEDSAIFVPSPTPASTVPLYKQAVTPRAPGTTELGEGIVRSWIEGHYAAGIDAYNAAADNMSDASDINIPEMSEGGDLLVKLAEQDQLIFALKKKLEHRGDVIVRLKLRVKKLEEEDVVLKGGVAISVE